MPFVDTPFAANPLNTGAPLLDPVNQLPQLDYTTKVDIAGGIRKFIEPLPMLGASSSGATVTNSDIAGGNLATSYIPVAVPDQKRVPGL